MPVQGVDVSKWQGEMSWLTCAHAGAKFALIRAGSIDNNTGQCYTDNQFKRNAELAPAAMSATGYYWYFRPNHDPIKQADYFCALIQPIKTWRIYPACDIEERGGKTPQTVSNAVMKFCDRVYINLKVKPMIYTSPGFWNTYVAPNPWAHLIKLWVAHWGVNKPTLPREWKEWLFWQTHVGQDGYQYGAQQEGIHHDVYNGRWEEFTEEFCDGGGETVPLDSWIVDYAYPWMVQQGYSGPKPGGAK